MHTWTNLRNLASMLACTISHAIKNRGRKQPVLASLAMLQVLHDDQIMAKPLKVPSIRPTAPPSAHTSCLGSSRVVQSFVLHEQV